MAKSSDSSVTNGDGSTKRGLFNRKPKADKGPSRLKQIGEVFQMTRRNDPLAVWLMVLAFLVVLGVSTGIGALFQNWITGLILGIMLGLLAATFILSRRAEKAAFSQIEGQAGAAGAALSTLRRGWIVEQQPVAANPRTQDFVFRAVGRPGVVLVAEGPLSRARPLADGERKRLARILPNVPIHVIYAGRDEGQTPIAKVAGAMGKLKPTLTKVEVGAVSKRLSSLGNRLPIPKGVDPYKARPDRRSMRGR
ncbi:MULTISPECIES: DUF4191 domain-containing protein [Arthrobacter]|uniref:DUF4191 domain-containing protein n=2 Tax=Arthrobacter TaxID=1663 RepID=A0ABU9KH13_9MICC|nr:DUF4191 domain-containing protein [Arthrobacter sp. YJM1]MDP5226178.1 DUF4191 domain-containing protein [Arthrobacter sp. YJM1]